MFHFRLQTVLEVRERLTRLRLKDFSEIQFRVQGLHEHMEENQRAMAHAGKDLNQAKQEGLTLFTLQQNANYRRRLQSENQRLAEQVREERQELEAKRKALVEARRAQRTLEILREKNLQRYEEEQEHRERAQLDEISTNFYVYNQRNERSRESEVE